MVKVFFPDDVKEDEVYQLAHIHENRGPHVLIACAVLSALATISVGLRILVRWRTRSRIEADDHTIFLTLVSVHLAECLYGQSVNAASRFWHGHRSLEYIMVWYLDILWRSELIHIRNDKWARNASVGRDPHTVSGHD